MPDTDWSKVFNSHGTRTWTWSQHVPTAPLGMDLSSKSDPGAILANAENIMGGNRSWEDLLVYQGWFRFWHCFGLYRGADWPQVSQSFSADQTVPSHYVVHSLRKRPPIVHALFAGLRNAKPRDPRLENRPNDPQNPRDASNQRRSELRLASRLWHQRSWPDPPLFEAIREVASWDLNHWQDAQPQVQSDHEPRTRHYSLWLVFGGEVDPRCNEGT